MLYDCRQRGLEGQLAEGRVRIGIRQSDVVVGFWVNMIRFVGRKLAYREA